MAAGIAFGQYLSGDSLLHRLDARTKLLGAIVSMFPLFASQTWWALAICALACLGGYLTAKVPFGSLPRMFGPLLVVLAFTIIANGLTFHAGEVPGAWQLVGSWGIRPDGLVRGMFLALRIVLLVLIMSLVTFTTTATRLTDAFAFLLAPLRHLHVPVEDLATMFSLAMRLIPIASEEAHGIMLAQRARGMRFDQGGPLRRLRAVVPMLVPLLIGLFRRADDLADAMEARCYTGTGRTHLRSYRMEMRDGVFLLVLVTMSLAVGVFL